MAKLKIDDLHLLTNLAARNYDDDPRFWEMIKRFTVLEKLRRKKYVGDVLDFSDLNLGRALSSSMACEIVFSRRGMTRLAAYFRMITMHIYEMQKRVN